MVRRKVTNRVPPIKSTNRAGSAWERTFLGSTPIQAQEPILGVRQIKSSLSPQFSDANNAPDILQNIELALSGNDAALLPYQPTPTINPGRPRTLAAGYDERSMTLRIKFRDGEIYSYYQVPPSIWYKFQRAQSPGRYINSTINRYPYSRGIV